MNPITYNPTQGPVPNPYLNNYAQVSAQTPFYSQPIYQPAGVVFLINSTQELSSIPNQAGLSILWCESEGKAYLRNCTTSGIQMKEYSLSIPQNNTGNNSTQMTNADISENLTTELFNKLDSRLSTIEKNLKTLKGGEPEWQL